MPIQPFRFRVCFSGLILFVRDADSKRITHVVFRSTRTNSEHRHDPYLCHHRGLLGCQGSTSCRLERERLTFRWLRLDDVGSEQPISRNRGGAGPLGWPGDLDPLPDPRNVDNFYWVPQLGTLVEGATIEPDCYANPRSVKESGRQVPDTVAVQVVLSEGTLKTGDFAYCAESKHGELLWVPSLRFRAPNNGATQREQAGAEKVIWELTAPNDARWLQITTEPLDKVAEPQEVARFQVVSDGVRNLTLSNNPPRRVWRGHHPSRLPNGQGGHFSMLYDFLAKPPEAGARPVPWVPETYWSRDPDSGSRPPRNVQPYVERAAEFQDCHLVVPDQQPEGTKERPICVPAVVDT